MDNFDAAWGSSGPRRAFVTFTGSAGEYFRIWIVNTFLTIITLGIYLAWAKVRKRRYFYWNTYLDGHHFDYLAEPKAILIGHLIVGGALLASNLTGNISPAVGGVLTLALYAAVPWLIYKAHRFRARYSAYRGLRFRFLGDVKQAYKLYAGIPGIFIIAVAIIGLAFGLFATKDAPPNPLVMVPVVGVLLLAASLLYPYWVYQRKLYAFSNLAYGNSTAVFTPQLKFFYRTYMKAGLVFLGAIIASGALITALAAAAGGVGGERMAPLFVIPFALNILVFLAFDQYMYAHLTSHCWNNTRLGPLTFEVEIAPFRLVWIKMTNMAATVATFGFLSPWAQVRWYGYVASCFAVKNAEAISDLAAAGGEEVSAFGDAAADVFDLDIGW